MTNKTALIIGGGRFLGRHIVARLLSEGVKTTMLTRGITPHPFEGLVEWLKCDREDTEAFDKLLYRRAFDYVIDTISYNAGHASHAADFFFGRTSRFIHISSSAVYLLNEQRLNPFREEDAPQSLPDSPPMGTMPEYGYHKRAGEIEIEKAIAGKGFPAVIIRPTVISGKYDYTQRDFGYIKRIMDGGPIILPVERCGSHSHVWIDDVVNLVMLSLTAKEASGKAFNATSSSILSMPDYIGIIARALGKKIEMLHMPHDTLKEKLGRGYSPFSYIWNFIPDIFRARTLLGYKPSRAETWLPELARYYASEYRGDDPEEYTRRRPLELELANRPGREKV